MLGNPIAFRDVNEPESHFRRDVRKYSYHLDWCVFGSGVSETHEGDVCASTTGASLAARRSRCCGGGGNWRVVFVPSIQHGFTRRVLRVNRRRTPCWPFPSSVTSRPLSRRRILDQRLLATVPRFAGRSVTVWSAARHRRFEVVRPRRGRFEAMDATEFCMQIGDFDDRTMTLLPLGLAKRSRRERATSAKAECLGSPRGKRRPLRALSESGASGYFEACNEESPPRHFSSPFR